jgi:hypothetical protein
MQDLASDLRRIHILRTPVNKGPEEGPGVLTSGNHPPARSRKLRAAVPILRAGLLGCERVFDNGGFLSLLFGEVDPAQEGTFQDGTLQVGEGQVGTAQVGIAQVSLEEERRLPPSVR